MRLLLPNRVLVVDDSLTMRGIVRKILVASRFRLDYPRRRKGIDALRKIASGKFDIVFLDYNMPGLERRRDARRDQASVLRICMW